MSTQNKEVTVIGRISERLQRVMEGRNPTVDFLRGLSIFVVIMLHFGMTYTSDTSNMPRIFSLFYWGYLSRNGYLGVSAFFVISGFLITSRSLAKHGELKRVNIPQFYASRFARIVPPLLLLVGSYLLLNWIGEPGFSITNTEKISNWDLFIGSLSMRLNLYWKPFLVVTSSLGVLWSLSIEEAFYVFFPIICRVLRKTLLISTAFGGLIVYAVYYRFQTSYPETFFDYFSCFDLLALGCLLAIFKNAFPNGSRFLETEWMHRLSMGLICLFYFSHHDREWDTWGSTIFGACVALFLISVQSNPKTSAYNGKFSKLIRIMGIYSYEIYLFHFVVAQLMTNRIFPLLNQVDFFAGATDIFFLLFWGATLGSSILISEAYSEPVRKWIIKLTSRPQKSATRDGHIQSLPTKNDSLDLRRQTGS